ncbi:ABC transporter substrate-binding protein [Vibrio nigripulchritudo]|uniref:ABC transporter substrate-binding protein n=1 Tax=Vibrio nigripulchritudo TaxID=28173 RepID=UPI0003B1CB40|nr:ABC transporter substrate-binding protein [Vibrio nigripulchritudo]CCN73182.1 putative ABC-type sugar transport system,periplasmic component [Vibrio nigripulchritudo SFn118]
MKIGYSLILLLTAAPAFSKPSFELLHWWTANGENAALSVIEDRFHHSPVRLVGDSITGGGGAPAKTILQARAIAGNPPNIAQMEGPAIQSWAALGFLHNVNTVADAQNWDQVLYPEVQKIHRYEGNYVAIPLNIHRLNWMWVNTEVLAQHGVAIPHDWHSLLTSLTELKAKGITPLALGREQWQIVQLFENIAFGIGGADYYRKAFVQLEPQALKSQETEDALQRFRAIANITREDMSDKRWDQGTQSLIEGHVAFQITGDWALGEMLYANATIPDHIDCIAFPSTEKGFIYNIDSLAFFKAHQDDLETLSYVTTSLSQPEFLLTFSQKKGAIPAQKNISVETLSRCQKKSHFEFNQAINTGNAMPSFIDSMAVNPIIQNAVSKELYKFFNDPSIKTKTLINNLSALSHNI